MHLRRAIVSALAVVAASSGAACDKEQAPSGSQADSAPAPVAPTPPAPPPEVRAPDIVVDPSYVSIGNERVPTGDPGLADRIAVFLTGRPMVADHTVDVVVMRNAKPGEVLAVVSVLKRLKASGAAFKTEARDNTTQRLPLSFTTNLPACTTVAWIAKNAAIDVWPMGGGTAKRVVKGLAGPDMTLGLEAVRAVASRCDAPALVVGADEAMTWGLVFDLATMALQAPGSRSSSIVLAASAVPGRKLILD